MATLAELLDQAIALSVAEREELAAQPPPGISIDDHAELERRAAEARSGAPGVSWADVKRALKT